MAEIRIENNRSGYLDVLSAVLNDGDPVGSRVSLTLELMPCTIVLENPRDSLPLGIGRGVNTAIAAVEALSLIGGVVRPELLCAVGPNFVQFTENGEFHGAYGPRTREQYPEVLRRLRDTPNTRQAVATIWEPHRDLPVDGHKDYPCTLSHAFYIRRDRLVMHTTMRSNDVLWGFSYDAFQFCQLQLTMANVLGIEPGPYYHDAKSLHLYERDFDTAVTLLSEHTNKDPGFLPMGLDGDTWQEVQERAVGILDGTHQPETETELWYRDQISKKLATV